MTGWQIGYNLQPLDRKFLYGPLRRKYASVEHFFTGSNTTLCGQKFDRIMATKEFTGKTRQKCKKCEWLKERQKYNEIVVDYLVDSICKGE